MEVEPFTEGCTVEVRSDDDGFHGSWYVATLVDLAAAIPTKRRASGSNKKNRSKKRTGYLVKYATLFPDDSSTEPLMEIVDPSCVRPSPPRNPRRNNDNQAGAEVESEEVAGDFQVYDVVDVYLRDGWWIGVLSKVIIDGEIKKYLVSFDCPPEEVEFEASQIRLHVDWIDSRWQLPPQKTPNLESIDKIVTQTSESNNDSNNGAHSSVITRSKEASMTESAYQTVVKGLSTKKTRLSRKKAVTSVEKVGLVSGLVTYKRVGRNVNLEEEEDLHENLQSSAGVENSGSKRNNEDSLGLEHEMIVEETCETEGGNRQLSKKRGRSPNLEFQGPNGSAEDNEEGRKRDSSGVSEISTELDEQPPAVLSQVLINPLPISNKSSDNTALDHDEPIAPAVVNEGQNTENRHELPFIKRSPIWATIESLEMYQNKSQNPHFSPLREVKEDRREGLAIAHMVTFANLVDRTANLQWTEPTDVINNRLETLVDLEANGFNVGPLRARLNEIVAKKDEAGRMESEMKEVEKEVEKCNREKTAIDKEIHVLQEKLVKAVAMRNVKDEEVMVVQAKLQAVSKRIEGWKLGFEELVRSPL